MEERNLTEIQSDKKQSFENCSLVHHFEFVKAQNNCILCATKLELQHVLLDDGTTIKEEAFCPACEVRTRSKSYPLN